MTKIITPAELALECETTPRTMRKFLRSDEGMGMRVGKGHRWSIEAKQVASLKKKFHAWNSKKVAEGTTTPDENQD